MLNNSDNDVAEARVSHWNLICARRGLEPILHFEEQALFRYNRCQITSHCLGLTELPEGEPRHAPRRSATRILSEP